MPSLNWILDFLKLLFHPVQRCTFSFKLTPGEKRQTFKVGPKKCIVHPSPGMSPGEPCYHFHRDPQLYRYVSSAQIRSHFNQPNLVSEFQRGSLDSQRKKRRYKLLAQQERATWGGERSNFSPKIFPGRAWLVWNGSSERRRRRMGDGGQTFGLWGMGLLHKWLQKWLLPKSQSYQFSSDGAQTSKGNLQMTDLDLLRGKDCEKMSRSIQLEQFLGLSVSGLFRERVRQTQAGGVFRPITLLFSCVPVKRFRRIQLQLRSSPTLGKARTWLSKRELPWRAGSQHIFGWAQKRKADELVM